MPSRKEPIDLRERSTVRIPWAHLNPALQEKIGRPADRFGPPKDTIRTGRRWRLGFLTAGAGVLAIELSPIQSGPNPFFAPALASGIVFPKGFGAAIRKINSDMLSLMKSRGILHPKFEELYPKRWIDPVEVAKTHPICFVAQNGDLVFKKSNRQEYYQYLWQKKLPGRAGFHAWRWRIYLGPPEAPEKVREWAKAKLQREIARLRDLAPKPVPRPVPAPVHPYRVQARRPPKRFSHARA